MRAVSLTGRDVTARGEARGKRMGRSGLGWAASAVAPWRLAVGVLLSITAEAEQERAPDASAYGPAGSRPRP